MPDDTRAARIADEELERIVRTGDPLAEMMREIVGDAVRLHIPLRDLPHLRETARALRILASRLEVESQSHDATVYVLSRARQAIRATQFAICPDYGKKFRARRKS